MSKKDNKALLADLQKQMAADVPPVMAKMQAAALPSPATVGPGTKPKPAKTAASSATGNRERTAVNLSPSAIMAIRKIQAMIMNEDGATTSASAVMCMALEFTAENLPGNKARLIELFAAISQSDKRRRA